MSISQMKLVSAIMKELEHQKVNCDVATMNACVSAANSIIAQIERPRVYADHTMSVLGWYASDDVGSSSKWLASMLFCVKTEAVEYPYDPADFGRCIRMLRNVRDAEDIFKELSGKIKADGGAVWSAYIDNWNELCALWDEESPNKKCPKLYKRMLELQGRPE